MAMIEDKELAQLFKAESEEHLARLDDGLLRLEKTPADQPLLEEVFRESHSLKGGARMLGLNKIEIAAHGLESILNTARKGLTPLTSDAIESMTVVLRELKKLVAAECGTSDFGLRIAEPHIADCGLRNAESHIADCGLRNAESTTAPQSEIPQSEIRNPKSDVPHSEIRNPQSNVPQSAIRIPQSDTPFRIDTVRVETRKLDDLLTLVGELSVIEGRTQHRLTLMDMLLEQWMMMERGRRKIQNMRRSEETETNTSAVLRQMLRAEEELLVQLGSRLKEARDDFFEDGSRLETTINILEERVHAVRLLPLSTVFAIFPRMVRDIAKQQDKEVELVIEGGEIGVDKRIIEEMKDPLMHLLRNAIDHGIESVSERKLRGKQPGATVWLRAVREGSSVTLEVRDDGSGLDLEAIRQVALKRSLFDAATLAAMTTAQLQQLIFMPGFSTTSFVTELSGRGVGMDVVRVNVERLKGDIRIESILHQGMAIQVRLPLSLATTRLLLVRAGVRVYGLPIEFIHTSRRVLEKDIFTLEGRPAIELNGQPVVAPRLTELLGLPAAGSETVCVVIKVGDELLGLRVDELLDEEVVVSKPLGAPFMRLRNVASLSILGSGEICAVLNPADLLRTAHKTSTESGMRSADSIPHSAISTPHSILLVEDSALVRAMEKRILEDAGYEVVIAVDGMDALDALGRRPFAAVVSDINMPNMDGLTLTANIRQNLRYKNLPVILVTALNSDEDKRRGLEVGANAYIFKPSFDQRVLLETLKRLV